MKRHAAFVIIALASVTGVAHAQERVDEATVAKIKAEGFQHSQVMDTLSWLTDVHGPRLTGSPELKAAAEWARDRLTSWGLAKAALEPWGTFGPGWSIERYSVEMTTPHYTRLIAYPHAWTTSTPGVVKGSPVYVEIASKDDFDKYRGKLKGAIVMNGKPRKPVSRFEPAATRLDDKQLAAELGRIDPGDPRSYLAGQDEWDESSKKPREVMEFLKSEGIAVLIEPSVRDFNSVEVAALGYYLSNTQRYFPAFVISKEQFGRITRLLDKKVPVSLELSLTTKFHETPADTQGFNVVAEIPGSDPTLADQVVMIGAHLDSWHSGTGATDNGAGSASVMEAMRILKTIGVKPRRTIRMALWSGEEQGYFGSTGYVKHHFGDPETLELKPEQAKVAGYFNLDNGSGRIRGVYLQANEGVRPIFEAWLKPFSYLGATTITTQNTGGTDHLLFNAVGIPGFQFLQDPLDYGSRTHHSNIDVYESVIEEDLQQAAVIMASFVYHTAMRDEMLPRQELPKPRAKTTKTMAGK